MGKITIDGKICDFNDGDYILQIARKNGIFIPALCYLSGCSPTLACRLCMADVDGKRVYTCNAKAKDGMNVVSNTEEIKAERRAIMQTYCVNHPLECGVCDKSGECELQNAVHAMGVSKQEFAIADSYKPVQNHGLIDYDPSLCIVCERCITVCKDKIGENAIKTVARDAKQVDKSLKDTMSKDAFAVWSKMQKNLIELNGECSWCGECTSVCPTGALVSSHFKYSSNAWELRKIPASNPHSSDCELIYYEVKQKSIGNQERKIYRVTNDYNFGEINPAARFAFDYSKPKSVKNSEIFNQIVEKIKNKEIRNIRFNSFITNEEAKILDLLREKFNLNLINDEAYLYQKFLQNFSLTSGEKLYNATSKTIENSDFIVVCGSFLRYDAPNVGYKVNNALKINKASGLYFHPFQDSVVAGYSKNFICIQTRNEIEILLWILQKTGQNLPAKISEILDNAYEIIEKTEQYKDENGEEKSRTINVKISKFAKNLGLDESKADELIAKKSNFTLIIGEDFVQSSDSENLAKLCGVVQKFTPFKVMIIPPRTNSLGVSLICKLSSQNTGKTLGYNENGDIKFGVLNADLDAPSLIQQEGTFTNYDARVVPTNAAISYDGYELNDIANALGVWAEFCIDYTSQLGENFKNIKFDDLENFYDNGSQSHRGYLLENKTVEICDDAYDFEIKFGDKILPNESEILLYNANPIAQFSQFSAASLAFDNIAKLYLGSDLAKKFSLQENDIVKINDKIAVGVKIDKNIDGAYLPNFDEKIDASKIFAQGRYCVAKISKTDEILRNTDE